MVHIRSNKNDVTTDEVLSWLCYLSPNSSIVKYWDNYEIKSIKIELSNTDKLTVNINNEVMNSEDSYWYRRGRFKFRYNQENIFEKAAFLETSIPLLHFLNGHLFGNSINKYADNLLGKLEMLNKCLELGINVPSTLVTTKLSDVISFLKMHQKIIAKPIKNPVNEIKLEEQSVFINGHTKLITQKMLEHYPDVFLPSLFQKYIDKKVEIRSFYLDRKFYSMAIFSQQNSKTKIDYRNYDYNRPNRLVPFIIPNSLEKKLQELMEYLGLNSGSFDIIQTKENNYVFLEVNPIGQFQWLSHNCNYYIEKKIAETLIVKK